MSHDDHDVHGPVLAICFDGTTATTDDCDCPHPCEDCDDEGIDRD